MVGASIDVDDVHGGGGDDVNDGDDDDVHDGTAGDEESVNTDDGDESGAAPAGKSDSWQFVSVVADGTVSWPSISSPENIPEARKRFCSLLLP